MQRERVNIPASSGGALVGIRWDVNPRPKGRGMHEISVKSNEPTHPGSSAGVWDLEAFKHTGSVGSRPYDIKLTRYRDAAEKVEKLNKQRCRASLRGRNNNPRSRTAGYSACQPSKNPRSRAAGYAGALSKGDKSYNPAAEQRGISLEALSYAGSVGRGAIVSCRNLLSSMLVSLFQHVLKCLGTNYLINQHAYILR